MMLGRLALWKGALLVSRTQAFVTGKDAFVQESLVVRVLAGRWSNPGLLPLAAAGTGEKLTAAAFGVGVSTFLASGSHS